MEKPPKEPPPPKSWDRRPWPTIGDPTEDAVYRAVGHALSQWEKLENSLSYLFSGFVFASNSVAARRAYVAVRTFEGRADMLRAASEAFFDATPHPRFLAQFKEILSGITSFAPRRNDVAHGVIGIWNPGPSTLTDKEDTYALYPTYASFKNRDVKNAPKYCYSSKEIDYFRAEFAKLRVPVSELSNELHVEGLFKAGAIGPLAFAEG